MIAVLFALLLPPAEEPPSDALAREVMASMGRLQSVKSYRLKMEDMIVDYQNLYHVDPALEADICAPGLGWS